MPACNSEQIRHLDQAEAVPGVSSADEASTTCPGGPGGSWPEGLGRPPACFSVHVPWGLSVTASDLEPVGELRGSAGET